MEPTMTTSLLIGFDVSGVDDKCVLIVGKKDKKQAKVINAFSGAEALSLYKKLIGEKE